jgi:flagellar biosynthesis GTPase FlhF
MWICGPQKICLPLYVRLVAPHSGPRFRLRPRASLTLLTAKATGAKKQTAPQLLDGEKKRIAREKEKAKREKEKLKEREQRQKEKAKEKERAQRLKEKERERVAREKEKDKARTVRDKERARAQREKEKAKEKAIKAQGPPVPDVPKKAAGPYAIFFSEFFKNHRGQFAAASGKIDLSEATKAAGAEWKGMSDEAKTKYVAAAKDLKSQYEVTYREFFNSLSDIQRKAIEKKTGKKLPPPGGKRAVKDAIKNMPGNPGRPSTPFFLFLSEEKPDIMRLLEEKGVEGSQVIGLLGKEAGRRWRALTEEQKQVSEDELSRISSQDPC